MTEKELISLGFEKQIEEDEENSFYYYTLDIKSGLTFITDSNDDIKDNDWNVEIFEVGKPSIKFTNPKTLSTLIEILKSNNTQNKDEAFKPIPKCTNRKD